MIHTSPMSKNVIKYRIGDELTIDQFYKYKIIDIKEGGMAVVLILERLTNAGFHDLLHRRIIAIKTFKPTSQIDHDIDFFKHELNMWINIDSPNVVPLLKVITLRNNLMAIMPYYEGNLRRIMERERVLDEFQCIRILRNVINGLSHSFKKYGIVHQDIKPENILSDNRAYSDDNTYLVSDWGIANLQKCYYPKAPNMDARLMLFETLSRMGTLPYMSPERLLRHYTSIESDIFSLGIMFFEMLFGHPPLDFNSEKELPYQIIEADYYYFAKEKLKDLSDNKIGKVILRCINPEIKKRYDNYDKLRKDLNRISK